MTNQERRTHQERVRSMKSYEECQAYMEQHREQMQARARERGTALGGAGPGPGATCDFLRK